MKRLYLVLGCMVVLGSALRSDDEPKVDPAKLPPAASGKMEFYQDIQPILARSCVSCHGNEKQKGGLRLDLGHEAMKGGNTGPVIKPGDGAASRLLHVVGGIDPDTKMPPDEKKKLSEAEVSKLRAWIDQGAVWPKTSITDPGVTARVKSTHWSFQPISRPTAPKVVNSSWVRNEIDAFVLARLEAEKIKPSPEADRVTLIRRLSLDLLGLPPTPQEVDEFIKDEDANAYEKLVDRLLASPHYGERWGRHWLDLARYADSDGYEKDTGRPFAWRYRNWVIDAFNLDLPFDRFTIEQLAGDLLPNTALEQKIATGFHRNTLVNKEGGVDQEQFRVEAVVDRVNTTAKVFLGVSFGCAQCHDHKYDPFSQREYYQFLAFFNSDIDSDIPAPMNAAETETFNKKKAEHDKRKAELQAAIDAYQKNEQPALQAKWESELKLPEVRKFPPSLAFALLLDADKRSDQQKKEVSDRYAKIDKKLIELNKPLAEHMKKVPVLPQAQTMAMGPVRKTNLMIRGDFLRKGVEVDPGAPAVLHAIAVGDKNARASRMLTRLDLAKWIVDTDNPLTARVAVNWVWHKYFGRGIVPTLEDFGTQGEKPSHPELLDWLASELVSPSSECCKSPGWSLKSLHKLIVSSATYRQASKVRPELSSRDPLNVLLARQNRARLEAEIIRDLALASSGLLTPTIGGPSVRPPQPAGISELTYGSTSRWVDSTGPDRYRRGMYTWFQRTSPYPMLMTFDAPDSNVCCIRRERSNTPLQALTLLNDTVFFDCARALGKRLMEAKLGETHERIRNGFRLCVAREPSTLELNRLTKLFDDLLALSKAKPEDSARLIGAEKQPPENVAETAAWIALARTLLNLDEFVTRE